MTDHKDLKRIIRERQRKTSESYTTARTHVMRHRAALLGRVDASPTAADAVRVEAVILKVNEQSARVRVLNQDGQITFRCRDVWRVVPGHLVTLVVERRWTWRGDAYASGKIEAPRIDIAKLGLEPLALTGGELEDAAVHVEPYAPPDPYAPLWRELTAKPRPSFEFDGIAWGAFPGMDIEENLTREAAELAEAGDDLDAADLLMEALGRDLRCIDAHAHLGNLAFDRWPERAMVHYEIGIRIAELSLPTGFDGLLEWGHVFNRPFLRCLHGFGLCLWRLDRTAEARQVFERILSLSPNDNQGVRFCWNDVRSGRSWAEMVE